MTTAGLRTAVIAILLTLVVAAGLVLQRMHAGAEEGLKITIPTLDVVQKPPPPK